MSGKTLSEFKNICVLGASGKMGRGIVFLMAQYFFKLNFKKGIKFELIAIDLSERGLKNMISYLEVQLAKFSEKNFSQIIEIYSGEPDEGSKEVYFKKYTEDVLKCIKTSTSIESAKEAALIFEAVAESIDLKAELMCKIEAITTVNPFYFTNTSSIPIKSIEQKANIKGRVIGFHFYNPPPVQKLLEIIKTDNCLKELELIAQELAKSLNKTVVNAPDFTGFIGNGVFIREVSYAIGLVESLALEKGLINAVFLVNEITKKLLIRPMGIFEVVDYVGINVCKSIMDIMENDFKNEHFNNALLKHLLEQNIIGGQDNNGKVKNGIFKYESGEIVGVFNSINYSNFDQLNFDELVNLTWRELRGAKNMDAILSNHFVDLSKSNGVAAKIAVEYLKVCNKIGKDLVADGIAFHDKDVNSVMTLGFHHLYGPIIPFLKKI